MASKSQRSGANGGGRRSSSLLLGREGAVVGLRDGSLVLLPGYRLLLLVLLCCLEDREKRRRWILNAKRSKWRKKRRLEHNVGFSEGVVVGKMRGDFLIYRITFKKKRERVAETRLFLLRVIYFNLISSRSC